MIYLATYKNFDGISHYFYRNNDIIGVSIIDFIDYDASTDYFGYDETELCYMKKGDIFVPVNKFTYKEYLPNVLRYINNCDMASIENVLYEMILKKL
jgi:hypothetical protein